MKTEEPDGTAILAYSEMAENIS